MITKATIGKKVRIARTRQNPKLRQRDVDELVGVPHGRTAHYENGRAAAPHQFLIRISEAWNIPVAWFLSTDSDELPGGGNAINSLPTGYRLVALQPDLPIGQAEDLQVKTIGVDSKFAVGGAFACRMTGDILGPRVAHGDLLVFWPGTSLRLGVISLSTGAENGRRLVVPVYNVRTGATELFAPGTDEPAVGVNDVSAFAVGVVRAESNGDTITTANLEGIRL